MAPTLLVLAGLMIACGAAGELAEGEIALSAPQCELFVVRTASGFSLLNEQKYLGVFEGDHVRGLLSTLGVQHVEVVGEMTLTVTVESWGVDREQATRVFHRRCKTRPVVNHDQD